MTSMLFSIIIPTYNRSNVIGRAIESVLNQTYQNWELIIVDDSKESQAETINSFNEQRIKYIFRGAKLGVGSARNLGAAHGKGDYLIFLDDDDSITTNYLSDFYDLITKTEYPVDICYCGMKIVDGHKTNSILSSKSIVKSKRGVILAGAWTIRSEFFKSIGGYDNEFLFGESAEFLLRCGYQNPQISYTDNLNIIRIIEDSAGASKNLQNIIESNKLMLVKHQSYFDQNKEVKIFYKQVIGVSLLRLRNHREARIYLWDAFLLNPFKVKALIRLMVSYFTVVSNVIYVPK